MGKPEMKATFINVVGDLWHLIPSAVGEATISAVIDVFPLVQPVPHSPFGQQSIHAAFGSI